MMMGFYDLQRAEDKKKNQRFYPHSTVLLSPDPE